MKKPITLTVNQQSHQIEVDPGTPLLYVLRNELSLNGPRYGCGLEQCAACMVLLDGKANPSCRIPVAAVQNKSITTLEGLVAEDGTLHPVQQAFVDQQAAQCGYCLNGMVITAVSLLDENASPSETDIREGMQKVLCRCSVQTRVIKAIQQASHTITSQN